MRLIDADKLKTVLEASVGRFGIAGLPENIMDWIEDEIDGCPIVGNDWTLTAKRLPDTGSHIKLWLTIELDPGEYATIEGRYSRSRNAFLHPSQWTVTEPVVAWKPYHEPEPYRPEGSK